MKLRFKINYHTQWGQKLYVCGDIPALGDGKEGNAVEMYPTVNGDWEVEVLSKHKRSMLSYKYLLKDDHNQVTIWEHGPWREVSWEEKKYQEVRLEDCWRSSRDMGFTLMTDAFAGVLFDAPVGELKAAVEAKPSKKKAAKEQPSEFRFQVMAPRITADYEVRLMGSVPELGGWNAQQSVAMTHLGGGLWQTSVLFKQSDAHVKYKFAIFHKKSGKQHSMETGDDRHLFTGANQKQDVLHVIAAGFYRYAEASWKGSGVAIPVFSIRTGQSAGVGEFSDIKPMADWAASVGMKMLQILPVNDTIATYSWIDSYPYAAVSVYALHPIYMNVEAVGALASPDQMQLFKAEKQRLNALPEVDYEGVMKLKMDYLLSIFLEKKASFGKSAKAKQFMKDQGEWLKPYAVFSFLRDKFRTPDFSTWGEYAECTPETVDAFFNKKHKDHDAVQFYVFLQYHLHEQLLDASKYARKKGVILKGDIPIGIYRHSADAWSEPRLYNMNGQAGAPPDDFAVNGQNWGFPTYNWDEMAKDGYKWWRSRMQHMAQYFQTYRIDHILGFFRIWEIPLHSVQGLLGQFRPSLPVHIDEIYGRGIHFDYDRYCKPYIREHILQELFGKDVDYVKKNFLQEQWAGIFQFREEFDTQLKIKNFMDARTAQEKQDQARMENVQEGLYALHNEVLFVEALGDASGQYFVPRVTMHLSRSYKELPDQERRALWDLYVDYFFRRQEELWRSEAMKKLPAIKESTNMLVCGEDLGMVPDCVPGVMSDLNILSLEIQRMPKNPRIEFGHPADYPYMAVISTSTHDMAPVRKWWEEDREKIQKFYNNILGMWGEAPAYCEPWIAKAILDQHMYAPSMWAVFPLQDLMAISPSVRRDNPMDEQINVPAIKHHYWKYRMHLTVEEMMQKTDFSKELSDVIVRSGRNTPY